MKPTAEQLRSFFDLVVKTGAVAGHPETIAALRNHPEWAGLFPRVRLMECAWFDRGQLVTGSSIAEALAAREVRT